MSVAQRVQRIGRRIHRSYWLVSVVYQSVDGDFTDTLDLVPGLRATQSTTEDGVLVDQMMTQWLVEKDLLPRAPKRGDTITWDGTIYRVVHPGGGREYDQRDVYGDAWRIHTVLIGDPFTPVETGGGYGQAESFYGTPDGHVYGGPDDAV